MNKILPPIRFHDQGPTVANLQEALIFITEKRHLTPGNISLAQWQQTLQPERATQTFDTSTRRLFLALLTDLAIPDVDFVNESTAGRLNSLLDDLGAFSTGPNPSLSLGSQGSNVAELHNNLRQLGYTISVAESAAQLFGESTRRAVASFQ